ncbi:unnamed protein product [Parnassius mnemosyne]|uniref:Uncharacterized protein n=1 Tax=Parnassius mnemosyne TaxID=213953 RepID=A0AAV1LLQ3_9NEOP
MLRPDSSLYSTILREQTYLAMSTTRQQYVFMSSLDKCKDFATESKVCNDLLIYNINTRHICEVVLLITTSQQVPEVCDVTTFSAHINTFQALRNNNWIYILQRKTPYALECGSKMTNGEISGAGIISLEQGCKMYTAFVTLLAENTKPSTLAILLSM